MVFEQLQTEHFADLFGTDVSTFDNRCRQLISSGDFRYKVLEGGDRDQALLAVLKRIDSGQLSKAGTEGKGRWEKGWSENLEGLLRSDHSLSELVPKYIRPNQSLRLDQQYIEACDPNFEYNWYEVFRRWLFSTYFRDIENVYEFGCGSGFNLAALAQMYPDKNYHGLDWAPASKEIVDELGKIYGWSMRGFVFDFFNPDETLEMAAGSAVLTIGALEQTGQDYERFLNYLLDQHPLLCVHVEPIVEWYDSDNLIDYAAIRFHDQRRYWRGFPGRLERLEEEGIIEILKMKRSYFGSLHIEGYSQTVWRPSTSR